MKLKLKDILPNTYRNFTKNPLKKDKIKELENSINDTGFWDNVVVRKNSEGQYELAYGHHRVQAAMNVGIIEADFIVKELDDAMMLKIMDNENRETYGTDLLSTMESVEGVVRALAEEKIPPFETEAKARISQLRYAPSFVQGKTLCDPLSGSHKEKAYTRLGVARFLGRTRKNDTAVTEAVLAAFDILELEELKCEGWSRKELIKRGVPGVTKARKLGANDIIKQAASIKKMARQRLEAAKQGSKKAEDEGKKVQETLDKILSDQLIAKEESDRLEIEYATANRERNVDKAKEIKSEIKRKAEEEREREKRKKETEKSQKQIIKEEKKEKEKEEIKKAEKKAKKEALWLDQNNTLLQKLEGVFSDSDPLLAELKSWREDERTTEQQRSLVALSLRDIVTRIEAFSPKRYYSKGGAR